MTGHPALRTLGPLLAVAALLAASCGGASTTVPVSSGTPAQDAGSPQSEPTRIRFALEPDPVWEWLEDSGTVAEWEAARNIRIEASSPFDQFSAFAGGHADMVVINALDVPQFVEQSDRDPAIIGKYTTDRSILAVRRTSRAENLDDLVERRIAVESSLGSTLLWGLIAEALHGLEFQVGSPDFDLVVVDPASVADLVMRGDAEACICVPDFSVPYLAEGTMKALYGGRSAAEIYAEDVVGDPDALPMADAFLIDQSWRSQNEAAVASVLELWEVGLQRWESARHVIIADYPQLFSVTTDAEIAWITDYATAHDWVVSSVYISDDEAAAHYDTFAEMQRIGLLDADAARPVLDIVHSDDGEQHGEPGSDDVEQHDDGDQHGEPGSDDVEQHDDGEQHGAQPVLVEPLEPTRG